MFSVSVWLEFWRQQYDWLLKQILIVFILILILVTNASAPLAEWWRNGHRLPRAVLYITKQLPNHVEFLAKSQVCEFFPREGDLTKQTKIFAVTSCDSSCGQEYRQWPSLRALVNCYAFFLHSPREIRAEKDKQRTIRTGRNKFNTNPKDVSPLGWTLLGGASSKWYLSWISTRIKMHTFLGATELASDWLATHLEPCILQLDWC